MFALYKIYVKEIVVFSGSRRFFRFRYGFVIFRSVFCPFSVNSRLFCPPCAHSPAIKTGIRTSRGRIQYSMEVRHMFSAAVWLMLSSMLCSLRLSGAGGSFPKPLSADEERVYLARSAAGDLDARNILIERNLRLVAHIMNNG